MAAAATGGGGAHSGGGMLGSLNDQQRLAVSIPDGPVVILAGPGSGKTKTLTTRVAWLVEHHRVAPQEIILVTFTNKAAREMKERVRELIGDEDASRIYMGTFHSIALRFLRRHARVIGLSNSFSIMAGQDSATAVRRILKELAETKKEYAKADLKTGVVQGWISKYKTLQITSNELDATPPPVGLDGKELWRRKMASEVMRRYAAKLKACDALDFDDILLRCLELFKKRPQVLSGYRYTLVDEFQDTNNLQYDLTRCMSAHGNLTVVGDPNQSIYSWRNAESGIFQRVREELPTAQVVHLLQNYRSTTNILTASSEVLRDLAPNKVFVRMPPEEAQAANDPELWTQNPIGAPVAFTAYDNQLVEAEVIARQIERVFRLSKGSIGLDGFAILLRTNAMSRAIEQALTRVKLPYRLVGTAKFFDRVEVKDCLAYLRVVANPSDTLSFSRIANIPKCGLGPKTIESLVTSAQRRNISVVDMAIRECKGTAATRAMTLPARAVEGLLRLCRAIKKLHERATEYNHPPFEMLNELLETVQYKAYLKAVHEAVWETKWENVQELRTYASSEESFKTAMKKSAADEIASPLQAFLEAVSLNSANEAEEDRGNTGLVIVSTIHSAKGLEWPCVFLPGLEDGILPHARSISDECEGKKVPIQEERRLLYVAMTRAKCFLFMSYAQERHMNGEVGHSRQSRFLTQTACRTMVSGISDQDIVNSLPTVALLLRTPATEEGRVAMREVAACLRSRNRQSQGPRVRGFRLEDSQGTIQIAGGGNSMADIMTRMFPELYRGFGEDSWDETEFDNSALTALCDGVGASSHSRLVTTPMGSVIVSDWSVLGEQPESQAATVAAKPRSRAKAAKAKGKPPPTLSAGFATAKTVLLESHGAGRAAAPRAQPRGASGKRKAGTRRASKNREGAAEPAPTTQRKRSRTASASSFFSVNSGPGPAAAAAAAAAAAPSDVPAAPSSRAEAGPAEPCGSEDVIVLSDSDDDDFVDTPWRRATRAREEPAPPRRAVAAKRTRGEAPPPRRAQEKRRRQMEESAAEEGDGEGDEEEREEAKPPRCLKKQSSLAKWFQPR